MPPKKKQEKKQTADQLLNSNLDTEQKLTHENVNLTTAKEEIHTRMEMTLNENKRLKDRYIILDNDIKELQR
jgi:hypothetical protein